MFFNERKKEYVSAGGPVRYLDGSSLARPFDLPKRALAVLCVFVLVAAVIGGVFLYNFLDTVLNASTREQASVEENLARDVSYDLPQASPRSWRPTTTPSGRRSPTQASPSTTRRTPKRTRTAAWTSSSCPPT